MPNICRMGYLLTLVIGVALATALIWKPAPPARFAGLSSGDVPRSVGSYVSGVDDPVPAEVKEALASASLTSRSYRPAEQNGMEAGDAINFTMIGGTDRSALHDPRSCLIGSGMQVENDHLELLPGTGIQARACDAVPVSAAANTSAGGVDIIYLYLVNGRIINQVTQIRAAMLWSALLGQRSTPVYFLRFTRPIYSDPRQDTQGHAAMLQFATEMWTRLQPRLLSSTRLEKGHYRVKQNHCRQYTIS